MLKSDEKRGSGQPPKRPPFWTCSRVFFRRKCVSVVKNHLSEGLGWDPQKVPIWTLFGDWAGPPKSFKTDCLTPPKRHQKRVTKSTPKRRAFRGRQRDPVFTKKSKNKCPRGPGPAPGPAQAGPGGRGLGQDPPPQELGGTIYRKTPDQPPQRPLCYLRCR